MGIKRPFVVGAAAVALLLAFVIGALVASRQFRSSRGCSAGKEVLKADVPGREQSDPFNSPPEESPKGGRAPEPIQEGALYQGMVDLAKRYASEIEPWDHVAALEAMKDLYYLRRPKVMRDERGFVIGIETESVDQYGDNAMADVHDPDATPPGTRRALDRIDDLLESISGRAQSERENLVLDFLTHTDLPGSDLGLSVNFLRASRVRCLLSLRDSELSEEALRGIRTYLDSDPDPIARGAAAAVLLSSGKDDLVRSWLRNAEDRALEALLADLTRNRSRMLYEASAILVPEAKAGNTLALELAGLLVDAGKGVKVRKLAAATIGARITQPWAIPTLMNAYAAEGEDGIRASIVSAAGKGAAIPEVEAFLVQVALGPGRPAERSTAAFVLSRSPTRTAVQAVVRACADPVQEVRFMAASGLIVRRGLLGTAERSALERQLELETDGDVRTLLNLVLGNR